MKGDVMKHLELLAEVCYLSGLIGLDEWRERIEVARWLASDDASVSDPRCPPSENNMPDEGTCSRRECMEVRVKQNSEDVNWLEFLFDGRWHFTKADPDPYPSTPHGHLNDPQRPWPKLNPYTGRVFKTKHQEDVSSRLSKRKMRELWRNEKFRSFCRDHILWVMEEYPHRSFPVANPLKLPRW